MDARTEAQLIAANARFYAAFAAGDLGAMDESWARAAPVACIHPGWPVLRARDAVMASWRAILQDLGNASADDEAGPEVGCADAAVTMLPGDAAAHVICKELVGPHKLLATNVFVREGEGDQATWVLVHHHAAPVYADRAPTEDEPERVMN